MRPLSIRFRRSLRWPLLTLIFMLITVIVIELALLARLGVQVASGQRDLAIATSEQIAAIRMENNAREQDMALFRYLRTGDPVHLEHLANTWVEFRQMLVEYQSDPALRPEESALLGHISRLEGQADTLAGVLIALRQHKATDFLTLRRRLDEASALLNTMHLHGGTGDGDWLQTVRSVEANLERILLAVSGYVAVSDPALREGFHSAAAQMRGHLEALSSMVDTPDLIALSESLGGTVGDIASLGERILATQDDEAAHFAQYAEVLQTLSQGVLREGLQRATADRQIAAREQLGALIRRTVLNGLILGGLTALLGLGGAVWLYRQAISAHDYSHMFQTLIDHAPFSVLLCRAQGTVTYANPAAIELLGPADPGEIIDHPNVLFDSARTQESLRSLFERARGGEVLHTHMSLDPRDLPFATAHDETLHLQASLFPIQAESRRQPTVVMVLRDITARVQAERAKAAAEREMEEQRSLSIRSDRLRSLGEMAAGIAHELNQPLVGVRGLAEHILLALKRGWSMDTEMIREKSSLIVAQADRMEHIIEHIRLFARESGRPELVNVSPNQVVQSSLDLLGAQLRDHGLELEIDLAEALPFVRANPYSLEEVVINLIINARDAMEERLQSTPEAPPPHLRISTQLRDGDQPRVIIEVTDWGHGISEAVIDRIFDPFFTTKGPNGGTGLGLSIARAIVEEFGGTLDIRSSPGEGTVATVAIEASDERGDA
ncbi:PAS domain-containing protein [Candidatus Sumerlaeota bacterium]|nr:PAS domain-containing protein [Candidatus Sumerlaeota bacterium]